MILKLVAKKFFVTGRGCGGHETRARGRLFGRETRMQEHRAAHVLDVALHRRRRRRRDARGSDGRDDGLESIL
jgi:hypothetical protein